MSTIKTLGVWIGKFVAICFVILVLLGGACTLMYLGFTPDKCEFVGEGNLDSYRIGAFIPDSVVEVTLDGKMYKVSLEKIAHTLVKGDYYYLYRIYRSGWNSNHIISKEKIDINDWTKR